MIPINGHLLIEPEVKDDFIASGDTTYNEIGKVITLPIGFKQPFGLGLQEGDRVYFDSWMASKFPDGKGSFYWLVPFDNIKGYEKSLSDESMQGGISPQVQDTITTSSGVIGKV